MKKIIDERGRLFGRISFIDVVVLVAVIVLAIGVFTKFNVKEAPQAASSTVAVSYTVKYPATRLAIADMLRVNDKLYTESGTYIGTIKKIDVTDAKRLEPLIDGTFVIADVRERYDIILTVEAQCSVIDGRYYADRVFELYINSEQKMVTKYNTFTGTIMSITAE